MTLAAYLEAHRIRQADFAARLGTTQPVISRLARRAATPSLDMAFRIERETGGAVPASIWVAAEREDAA